MECAAALVLAVLSGGFAWPATIDRERQNVLVEDVVRPPDLTQRTTPHPVFGSEVVHPYFGFAVPPTEAKPVRKGGDEDLEQYGFGWGSGPLVREHTPDRFVVMILGGSVARLFHELGGSEVVKQKLEQVPELKGKEIVMSSAAFWGYKQPQQLVILSTLLALGGQVDLVIDIDGFNEVALTGPEDVAQGVFPFYPIRWYLRTQDLAADPKLRQSLGEILVLKERRESLARFFSGPLINRSFLANLIWRVLDQRAQTAAIHAELAARERRETLGHSFAAQGPTASYKSDQESMKDFVGVWEQSVRQLDRLSDANGIRFFQFVQPNQYVEGSKPMGEEERALAWNEDDPYRPGTVAGYPLLVEGTKRLQKEGVESHDLSMVFANVTQPLYFDSCCHFNEEGNHILGEKIAEIITAALTRK